jgi:cysteine sulfinate desulfinase/cysteine desulfurase-like protein
MEIRYLEFLKHLFRFNRHVYLDNNATTPVSSRVQSKMKHALKYHYGNPSSFYDLGRKSAELMEQARRYVARHTRRPTRNLFHQLRDGIQ